MERHRRMFPHACATAGTRIGVPSQGPIPPANVNKYIQERMKPPMFGQMKLKMSCLAPRLNGSNNLPIIVDGALL